MKQDDLEKLLNLIEAETGVNEIGLKSTDRHKGFVWARFLFTFFAETYLGWTEAMVVKYLCKNRTTIIYYYKKHRDFCGVDKEYTQSHSVILLGMVDVRPEKQVVLTHGEYMNARLFNKRMLVGIDVC